MNKKNKKSRYQKSNEMLKEVTKIIPLGAQTFSKSYLQYVQGVAPMFVQKAEGSYIWDVDGNKYVDFINGLLPVILGYQYKAVDKAIEKQLKKGITFSLSSTIEYDLASLIVKHIPSAEMVRFGKNGSDVTSAAIRIARAHTQRDHVIVCGYHGWHDWYIGSTVRNLGVPKSTQKLTHRFEYNNIDSLKKVFEKLDGKVAAVIMEPMNYADPQEGFLEEVKKLTHENGALLIFDEIITGFRYHLGGAQTMFGVTPDLSTFGKSIANGMPLSVIAGKKEYMQLMDDIFFSATFGGETLSIAAAIATIKEMEKKKVHDYIWKIGSYLQEGVRDLIKKHELEEVIQIGGKPCWQIFMFHEKEGYSDLEIKSFVQQELLDEGFLWFGQHNISYSHKKPDLRRMLEVYDTTFEKLAGLLKTKTLKEQLRGEPAVNIFKVR